MLILDFILSKTRNNCAHGLDWASADDAVLRYDTFLGDIVFRVAGCDLSTHWGWVPIIDFAASMRTLVRALESGSQHESFEFTESSARIDFTMDKPEVVCISSTYGKCKGRVLRSELSEATDVLVKKVLESLTEIQPALRENKTFRALLGA